MKFCSKCGAKLPDEAKFCDKCGQTVAGTTAEAGARKKSKAPLILGIAAGVLSAAVIAVCVLIGTGVIGGAGEGVGTAQQPEDKSGQAAEMTPTGTSVSATSEATSAPTPTEAPEASKEDQMRCAWEAYKAYKKAIKPNASGEFWEYDSDVDNGDIGLFYLDADDYPEFLWCNDCIWLVLTYKQGQVSKVQEAGGGSIHRFSCKERQGYILSSEYATPSELATIRYYDGINLKEVWTAGCCRNEQYAVDEYGEVDTEKKFKEGIKEFEKNLAAQMGNEADWTDMVNWSDERTPKSGVAETLEDAYDKFVERVNLYAR